MFHGRWLSVSARPSSRWGQIMLTFRLLGRSVPVVQYDTTRLYDVEYFFRVAHLFLLIFPHRTVGTHFGICRIAGWSKTHPHASIGIWMNQSIVVKLWSRPNRNDTESKKKLQGQHELYTYLRIWWMKERLYDVGWRIDFGKMTLGKWRLTLLSASSSYCASIALSVPVWGRSLEINLMKT